MRRARAWRRGSRCRGGARARRASWESFRRDYMPMAARESLSDFLEEGRTLFNEGRFFEAHERWEEAWLVETGPSKLRLQGLIQIAAGFLKARQGRSSGAV